MWPAWNVRTPALSWGHRLVVLLLKAESQKVEAQAA